MKELKPKVQKVIDDWYKNIEHDIIQVWEQDDTWFIVIRQVTITKVNKLDFVRLFPSYRFKDEYHISVDNTVSV
jgi:hypothetical protein